MNVGDACRCCGRAAGSAVVATVPSTDRPERFSIERCGACGVLRTAPVPNDLSPYYATDLAATMKRHRSRVFSEIRRLQLERELGRLLRHGDPGTVVDVGCGAGDFVRAFARHGIPVVAADAGATRPAALVDAPSIPYARFDFDTYQLSERDGGGSFTVVLRHVLEHVRDPRALLTELIRQGGRHFYVVVPNVGSLERRVFGQYWYLWDPPRHLWHFDASTLVALCARVGLTTIAHGTDTTANLLPNLYRYLRLHASPAWLYERFGPTSALTGVTAPLNLLLPGNVVWLVARVAASA